MICGGKTEGFQSPAGVSSSAGPCRQEQQLIVVGESWINRLRIEADHTVMLGYAGEHYSAGEHASAPILHAQVAQSQLRGDGGAIFVHLVRRSLRHRELVRSAAA